MSRIPSNRNRKSQQSNARGIEHNTKFIPFFRHDKEEDTRIAYFIAHLREEVNRHKGINIPYIPTNIRTTLYEENIIPTQVTTLINTIARHPDGTAYDIKKLINYEIEYTGNIRFLLIPASMREDSELYHAWIGFFCQLFDRLHNRPINAAANNTALQFVKTLKDTEEKKDPYEYLFAVAVVRTFLKDLFASKPDPTGTPVDVSILDNPKEWHNAYKGEFISSDEMLIRLFAPGKIYNKKTLLVRTPALKGSFNLNLKQKYYNIQKGGALSLQMAKMYKDNLTRLQTYLKNFQTGLYNENDPIPEAVTTARTNLEQNYNDFLQALNMFNIHINDQDNELLKMIQDVYSEKPEISKSMMEKTKRLIDMLPSIDTYDKYKNAYTVKPINKSTDQGFVMGTIKLLSVIVDKVILPINEFITNNPGAGAGDGDDDGDDDDDDDAGDLAKAEEAAAKAKAAEAEAKAKAADAKAAEAEAEAKAKAATEKQQKGQTANVADADAAAAAAAAKVKKAEVSLPDAVKAEADQLKADIARLQKEVGTLTVELAAAQASDKTTSAELKAKVAELTSVKATLAGKGDAASLLAAAGSAITDSTLAIQQDIDKQVQPLLTQLQLLAKSGTGNTTKLDSILTQINNVVIDTLKKLTTQKFEIDIPESGDSSEDLIESLPTTKMYETLKQCDRNPNLGYITTYDRLDFETEDVDKFFKNRLKRLYKEVDNEINKRDTIQLDSTGTLAKIAVAHGIKRGDNKHKYERINGELVVTDLETNEKVKTTREKSCKDMGFNFTEPSHCYNFLNSCILGKNTAECKAKLGNINFWRTDLEEFRHNSNFKDVFLSLKQYGFVTTSKGILQQIESVDLWQSRNADVTVPIHVIALLRIAVDEINKHPAILNSNYTGPQKLPQAPHKKGDTILAMKLHPSSRESLPEELRQPTDPLKETGVIYKTDKITIAVNTRADEIKNLLKDEMKALQYELTLLKAPLLGASARTKYFHSQRGGSQDYDLHSYEHYKTMTLLKEHIKKLDTRISGILMQSFNLYINALNAKGIKLDVTNQNKIKEELAKIRRLEIFLTHTAFYVYKFIFFFSEFKAYLPIIDSSYEDFIGKIEINLDQLEKLVDATHAKFKTYCANAADGAIKSGKVYALATICSQLEELTFPKLSDLEELPPGFRYDDQKNKNKTGRTSYNYFT